MTIPSKKPGAAARRRQGFALAVAIVSAAAILSPMANRASAQRAPLRDPEHIFQQRVCTWQELRRVNVIMQKRDYSCGAAALATVARYFWGDKVGEKEFLRTVDNMLTPEEMKDREENGLALTDLRRAAVKMGYFSTIGTLKLHELFESKVPLVVPIKLEEHDHFVVYRGADGVWVYLADPIRGNVRTAICDFERQWQKNAVLVLAKPGRQPPKTSPLSVDACEECLGETSLQVVRTQPQKFNPIVGNHFR
jgi:predicted double-glycine peptidase